MTAKTCADAKQAGATLSERVLAGLCAHSFLALWSYPNLYRDQGKRGVGDGKELCDVLAVFGDDVLIFSDKACAFPTGPVEVAWRRWYKRAIADSIDQLRGAERWLRTYPDRVFLDRRCTQRFPIDLARSDRMRVHRIVVASGASHACEAHFEGSRGSLMMSPRFASPLEIPREGQEPSKPFILGAMPGEFVHFFDEVTLPIVMGELDTMADFIAYLTWKACFVEKADLFLSSGEEHLLAYYLTTVHYAAPARHDVKAHPVLLAEDLWDGLANDPTYQRARAELNVSYAWDEIIQALAEDILADRMVAGNEAGVAGHERRVRALASAPRRVRVALAMALSSLLNSSSPTHFRLLQHPLQPDTAYLFLVLAREGLAQDAYRRTRGTVMMAYCLAFARRNPGVRHVVGVSTGHSEAREDRSHEVVYVDRADWKPEDEDLATKMERDFGIYQDVKNVMGVSRPLPMTDDEKRRERNKRKRMRKCAR